MRATMGNWRSGWYRPKKFTVEESQDVDALLAAKEHLPGGKPKTPTVPLKIAYTFPDGRGREQQVELQAAPSCVGGVRWWFRCPSCGRRVQKLYLPPASPEETFACRICHRLTYRSTQTRRASRWRCPDYEAALLARLVRRLERRGARRRSP